MLTAPELRDSGLSDLLTADLLCQSFELVEREQLVAITKEIELSKLLSPEVSSQRLKVGQLVRADALVLLSSVEQDGKKSVKLVVCECRYGSRLKLEQFELAVDRLDQVVSNIAAEIERTRTKFARGVEQIIAVSPFLSKSLTHEFDHLQFGLAGLLGQALSEQPGTAVLEIEEARAIGIELERTGGNIQDRIVPTLIEAEFGRGSTLAIGSSTYSRRARCRRRTCSPTTAFRLSTASCLGIATARCIESQSPNARAESDVTANEKAPTSRQPLRVVADDSRQGRWTIRAAQWFFSKQVGDIVPSEGSSDVCDNAVEFGASGGGRAIDAGS